EPLHRQLAGRVHELEDAPLALVEPEARGQRRRRRQRPGCHFGRGGLLGRLLLHARSSVFGATTGGSSSRELPAPSCTLGPSRVSSTRAQPSSPVEMRICSSCSSGRPGATACPACTRCAI